MVKIFESRNIVEQVTTGSWETLKKSFRNANLTMSDKMWKTLTRVIYHNAKRLFYNYLFIEENENSDYKELLDSVTKLGNQDNKKDFTMARGPSKFVKWWEAQKNGGNARAAINPLKDYIKKAKRTDDSGDTIFIYKKNNWRDLDGYTDSHFNVHFKEHYKENVKKRQGSKYTASSSSSDEEERKSKSTRSRTRSTRSRTRSKRNSPSRGTLKRARSNARASVRARQNSAANKYKKINAYYSF